MSLADRVDQVHSTPVNEEHSTAKFEDPSPAGPEPAPTVEPAMDPEFLADHRPTLDATSADPSSQVRVTRLDEVTTEAHHSTTIDRDVVLRVVGEVRDAIGEIPDRSRLSDDRLRALVEQQTAAVLSRQDEQLDRVTVIAIRRAVADELLGFGPLQELLDREDVSEIMVNGHRNVFVERSGRLEPADTVFENEEQLLLGIERMVRTSGRRVDQSTNGGCTFAGRFTTQCCAPSVGCRRAIRHDSKVHCTTPDQRRTRRPGCHERCCRSIASGGSGTTVERDRERWHWHRQDDHVERPVIAHWPHRESCHC